ncbi:hypothetical protein T09_13157 [Trichinella sp. T9]|nr:hypothetical protein T09_13157 [Trichinella sp. T9]
MCLISKSQSMRMIFLLLKKNSKPYRYISNEKYALEKDHCLNLLPLAHIMCIFIIAYCWCCKAMFVFQEMGIGIKSHAITSVYLMQMVDCFVRLKEIYVPLCNRS